MELLKITDEYVPTIIPKIRARLKSRIEDPPSANIATSVKSVVTEVLIDLVIVSFNARVYYFCEWFVT